MDRVGGCCGLSILAKRNRCNPAILPQACLYNRNHESDEESAAHRNGESGWLSIEIKSGGAGLGASNFDATA